MSEQYLIYGLEMSPYSVKVRSWFRYKQIDHVWVQRSMARMPDFQALAKLPLIPLVQCPEGEVLQDSTPIIETLEQRHPQPPMQPASPVLAFLSAMLEEYADEWLNKPMFHYRWSRPMDQDSAALRIAREQMPGQPDEALAPVVDFLRTRMVPRLAFVGSHAGTASLIEQSFHEVLALLESHLATRPYLFGGRPCLADFGLYGQLRELASDPTPGLVMRECVPAVMAWLARMEAPVAEGEFETEATLLPALRPLIEEQVGGYFLPWSQANEQALAQGQTEFSVTLAGRPFSQQVQKYHARSLAALRQKQAGLSLPVWVPVA